MKCSSRFNFGEAAFEYNLKSHIIDVFNGLFQDINQIDLDRAMPQRLIASYLYFNGFAKTLDRFESVFNIDHNQTVESVFPRKRPENEFLKDLEELSLGTRASSNEESGQASLNRSFISMLGLSMKKSLFRKSSKKEEEKNSPVPFKKASSMTSETCMTTDRIGFFERSSIRDLIVKGKAKEAEEIAKVIFPDSCMTSKTIQAQFLMLQFLEIFKKEPLEAIIFAKTHFTPDMKSERLSFPLKTVRKVKKTLSFQLKELSSLLLVSAPSSQSPLAYLLTPDFLHEAAIDLCVRLIPRECSPAPFERDLLTTSISHLQLLAEKSQEIFHRDFELSASF